MVFVLWKGNVSYKSVMDETGGNWYQILKF
ncbi:hypothetical protein EMUR_04190 [Ehrlichia muris AS145]|uniref:Uncharacterized protein n=1 Tax=Ehrlichia muris AS145 TaxID=1423892 RepID=V9R7H0_9RICK|nr:hypothetical protein EMUR_04190 [Ehrlichia muris AS145]